MARKRRSRRGRTAPETPLLPATPAGERAPSPVRRRRSGRVRLLALGIVIGAGWGVVMCLILLAFGQIDSTSDWVVRILTTAGIGMVVATVFGTVGAARGGEPVGRVRFWRSRRG